MEHGLWQLWASTGLYNFTLGQLAMIAVGVLLIFLAINKGFEPLLLIPIGFGGILANIPIAGIGGADGLDTDLLNKSDLRMCLGKQTWPHMLVRGLMAEQIYRAQCILAGHPYHRD